MSIRNQLIQKFADFVYRHAYADEYLDSAIATQIKVLREQRELTQAQLAELLGMKQSQVARMESVNNSAWTLRTLKRVAKAFDLMLVVKYESFGAVLPDIESFGRQALQRPSFKDDPVFIPTIAATATAREDAFTPGGVLMATYPADEVRPANTFGLDKLASHVA